MYMLAKKRNDSQSEKLSTCIAHITTNPFFTHSTSAVLLYSYHLLVSSHSVNRSRLFKEENPIMNKKRSYVPFSFAIQIPVQVRQNRFIVNKIVFSNTESSHINNTKSWYKFNMKMYFMPVLHWKKSDNLFLCYNSCSIFNIQTDVSSPSLHWC